MSDGFLVCPRITYLSGEECTLDECDTVLKIKLRLCALNAWIPHEIILFVDGKPLPDDDPAPETASVLWKESEESDASVWRDDLWQLADFGDQAGANRCAAKSLSLNVGQGKHHLLEGTSRGNLRIVEAYISAGMDKKALGEALYCSTSCGHLHIVNALLSANVDANFCRSYRLGNRVLHGSCDLGHIDIAKALIAAHADFNARNAQNQTPLDICVRCGHDDIASILRDAGAQV